MPIRGANYELADSEDSGDEVNPIVIDSLPEAGFRSRSPMVSFSSEPEPEIDAPKVIKSELEPEPEIASTSEDNIECAICMEESDINADCDTNISILRCGHSFHTECIDEWKRRAEADRRQPKCPMCRSNFEVVATWSPGDEKCPSKCFQLKEDVQYKISKFLRNRNVRNVEKSIMLLLSIAGGTLLIGGLSYALVHSSLVGSSQELLCLDNNTFVTIQAALGSCLGFAGGIGMCYDDISGRWSGDTCLGNFCSESCDDTCGQGGARKVHITTRELGPPYKLEITTKKLTGIPGMRKVDESPDMESPDMERAKIKKSKKRKSKKRKSKRKSKRKRMGKKRKSKKK
tara:strand:- start:18 stop:1052 length:1035 start_codon:yes stop_codon:yes gene_type:complete